MNTRFLVLALCLVAALAQPNRVCAEGVPLPTWELGLGMGSLFLPDYHGSDEYRPYVLPIPYIVYRGDALRIDDSGLYGEILDTAIVKIDVSVGAGLPVSGEINGAREGMPALDPSIEGGPLLTIFLRRTEAQIFSLNFAVRQVLSLGKSRIGDRGLIANPYLHLQLNSNAAWNRYSSFYLVLGPTFGNRRYHDAYYEVDASQVTAERAQYHPPAGYQGTRITFTYKKRFERHWLGSFIQYESLRGAAFRKSPLFKSSDYFALGLASSYVFYP